MGDIVHTLHEAPIFEPTMNRPLVQCMYCTSCNRTTRGFFFITAIIALLFYQFVHHLWYQNIDNFERADLKHSHQQDLDCLTADFDIVQKQAAITAEDLEQQWRSPRQTSCSYSSAQARDPRLKTVRRRGSQRIIGTMKVSMNSRRHLVENTTEFQEILSGLQRRDPKRMPWRIASTSKQDPWRGISDATVVASYHGKIFGLD